MLKLLILLLQCITITITIQVDLWKISSSYKIINQLPICGGLLLPLMSSATVVNNIGALAAALSLGAAPLLDLVLVLFYWFFEFFEQAPGDLYLLVLEILNLLFSKVGACCLLVWCYYFASCKWVIFLVLCC